MILQFFLPTGGTSIRSFVGQEFVFSTGFGVGFLVNNTTGFQVRFLVGFSVGSFMGGGTINKSGLVAGGLVACVIS